MAPAEAIYALIDRASGQDNEESISLSDTKGELDNVLSHMQNQATMIQECTKALHAVSKALTSVEETIRNLSALERDY